MPGATETLEQRIRVLQQHTAALEKQLSHAEWLLHQARPLLESLVLTKHPLAGEAYAILEAW